MRLGAAILLAALAPAAPAPGATGPVVQAPSVQPGAPGQAATPPGPAPEAWLARPMVDLIGLDKVSSRPTALSGRIGQELHFGTLTVVARACMVRGPDAAPDAAAFLEITDDRTGTPPFRSWMLLSAPALAIYEHPVYDIRLAGCRAG